MVYIITEKITIVWIINFRHIYYEFFRYSQLHLTSQLVPSSNVRVLFGKSSFIALSLNYEFPNISTCSGILTTKISVAFTCFHLGPWDGIEIGISRITPTTSSLPMGVYTSTSEISSISKPNSFTTSSATILQLAPESNIAAMVLC